MSILKTVSPENAEGRLEALYGMVEKTFGRVANNVKLFGVSPVVLENQLKMLGYYSEHKTIKPEVFALIRLLIAKGFNNQYCTNFNTGMLKEMGFDTEGLLNGDMEKFEKKDQSLVEYVVKAINRPEETGEEDIVKLKKMGWKEIDIFDALEHGARMVYVGHIFKAFKLELDV